jgi:hypothetical protein
MAPRKSSWGFFRLMNSLRASLSKLGWRRVAFSLVVLVTLGLFGLVGIVLWQPDLVIGLFGSEMAGHISQHFRLPHHRIHDLTFSFIVGTALIGIVVQIQRPLENVAGQLMALIPWIALMLVFLLTNSWVFAPAPILGALTLAATILHPRGRDLFSFFSPAHADRVMLALVIVAAVPLLVFASTNIGLQRIATNDHAALGHYGFMAAFSFTLIGAGLLASLRPDGWRFTACVAGALAAFLGLVSVMLPDVDSSFDLAWAVAAIAWGGAFVAAAEFVRRGERTRFGFSGDIGREPDSGSAASTPRWIYAVGIIAVVLSVLLVIHHLGSAGFARHTP